MNVPHHKFGCLSCGRKRYAKDILSKQYDLYLMTECGTRVVVGLCPTCFNAGNYDLEKFKAALHKSESDYLSCQGKCPSGADFFKHISVASSEPRVPHLQELARGGG